MKSKPGGNFNQKSFGVLHLAWNLMCGFHDSFLYFSANLGSHLTFAPIQNRKLHAQFNSFCLNLLNLQWRLYQESFQKIVNFNHVILFIKDPYMICPQVGLRIMFVCKFIYFYAYFRIGFSLILLLVVLLLKCIDYNFFGTYLFEVLWKFSTFRSGVGSYFI